MEEEWRCEFDAELFGVSKKARKTRRQKQEERHRRKQLQVSVEEEESTSDSTQQVSGEKETASVEASGGEARRCEGTDSSEASNGEGSELNATILAKLPTYVTNKI